MKKYLISLFLRSKYILLLLGILFFHLYMNYEVLSKSQVCRTYDEALYLDKGRSFYNIIFRDRNNFKHINRVVLKLEGQAHPPLVQFVQAAVIKLLTVSAKQVDSELIILITNGFFLFLLLISVYYIGSLLYGKAAGIFAAFLVSFFPMIYGQSRNMLLDFPLTGMTALSFWFLFKTNKFYNIKYSILLGIVLGLAALIKESYAVFIFFPLIYYVYVSFKVSPARRAGINLALSILFAVLVAGIVYLRPVNFHVFNQYINLTFFISKNSTEMPWTYLKYFLLYPGVYLSIALVPALVSYFKNIRLQDKTVLLWFFAPLIVFTLFPNRSLRFLIPILPAFALIAAAGVFQSKITAKIKGIYILFLILSAFMQYFIYLFNFSFLQPLFKQEYTQADFPALLTYRNDQYYSKTLELLNFFEKENKKLELSEGESYRRYEIFFLFQLDGIHSFLRHKIISEDLPFNIYCPEVGGEIFDIPLEPGSIWPGGEVLNADYIIDIDGANLIRTGRQVNIADKMRVDFHRYGAYFKLVADFKLSGVSSVYIYKNLKLRD